MEFELQHLAWRAMLGAITEPDQDVGDAPLAAPGTAAAEVRRSGLVGMTHRQPRPQPQTS